MAFNNQFHGNVGQVIQVEGNVVVHPPQSPDQFRAELDKFKAALSAHAAESPHAQEAAQAIQEVQNTAGSGATSGNNIQSRLNAIAQSITTAAGASDGLTKIGKALGTFAAFAATLF
ncbi:hypothetical protein [Alteromonas halophila]|uniref:Uncharacterized protein n=1 Tax=Alteromonas halophila TaxID=516698 RepID=A0A918JQ17_9ALTE|nr:hypothetical protein [Alteromonas halophila]GGW92254.1 hypothetical protein GCM10007391_28230 [Alteromonas halophila]